MAQTSEEVRGKIVETLHLDLIGPDNSHAFAKELLPDSPSKWYLTGYIIPSNAPDEQRCDDTSKEEIESGESEANDASMPDRAASRNFLPSSIGLTVLVPAATSNLGVIVEWGDYVWESGSGKPEPGSVDGCTPPDKPDEKEKMPEAGGLNAKDGYRRSPRFEKVMLPIPQPKQRPLRIEVPNSDGLFLNVVSRTVGSATSSSRLPTDTRSVTIFVVNYRLPDANHACAYRSFAFQIGLQVTTLTSFVPRPDLRGCMESSIFDDWDERVADLHYRDVFEYAVGHGVSAESIVEPDGTCCSIRSVWLPTAEVERVAPSIFPGVELGMEALGVVADAADASSKLLPLVKAYREWIGREAGKITGLEPLREKTCRELIQYASHAAKRIEDGIDYLKDPDTLEAFRIMNRAMALAARKRQGIAQQKDPMTVDSPRWYPFQLAFILIMRIQSCHEPGLPRRPWSARYVQRCTAVAGGRDPRKMRFAQ